MRQIIFALILFAIPYFLDCSSTFASEFSNTGFDNLRIENEIKLAVPFETSEELWRFLQDRFQDQRFLHNIDPSFNVRFGEELFEDQYFDTDTWKVINAKHGIRHRSRTIISGNDDKDGKELMQIKINDFSENVLARGEFKYKIKHYTSKNHALDNHPFLRVVKRKHRNKLLKRLREYGFNGYEFRPSIYIEQTRKRIYINRNTSAFATLTLDFVEAAYQGKKVSFVELEMELNENNYTLASFEMRKEMEELNSQLKESILSKFPEIKQNQLPKYNKAYNLLNLDQDDKQYAHSFLIFKSKFWFYLILLLLSLGLFTGLFFLGNRLAGGYRLSRSYK